MTTHGEERDAVRRSMDRRRFVRLAAAGTAVGMLGGAYLLARPEDADREYRSLKRPDGRPRLPPGQRVVDRLQPMGGYPGDPSPANFLLRVHGEVEQELFLTFDELLELPQVEQVCDVHCVTSWTVLDSRWHGVRVSELARLAGVRPEARHVFFEAAYDYMANVPLEEALAPNVLVAHRLEGAPLALANGAPVRALVPDLYFWKSSKWLTGLYFSREDRQGYWELRGYHNHGCPWLEERYA